MCVKYLWIKFYISKIIFVCSLGLVYLFLYTIVYEEIPCQTFYRLKWNKSCNLKIIHVRTLFIDLHRIRSIFQSTSIGSNNLLFYTERSWRSGTGLWLGNESLVWLSAANQIYLTKYVCPSIHLFICLSVQQPVNPPACPLVYCQSMSTSFNLSVNPSSCTSMHKSWSTFMSVQPYLYLITCPFTYPSAYSCTIGFSFSPTGYVPVILSIHLPCFCLSSVIASVSLFIIQSVVHLLDWLLVCLLVYWSLRQACITERLKWLSIRHHQKNNNEHFY